MFVLVIDPLVGVLGIEPITMVIFPLELEDVVIVEFAPMRMLLEVRSVFWMIIEPLVAETVAAAANCKAPEVVDSVMLPAVDVRLLATRVVAPL